MKKFLRMLVLPTAAIALLLVWQVESFADAWFGPPKVNVFMDGDTGQYRGDYTIKQYDEGDDLRSILEVLPEPLDNKPSKYTFKLHAHTKAFKGSGSAVETKTSSRAEIISLPIHVSPDSDCGVTLNVFFTPHIIDKTRSTYNSVGGLGPLFGNISNDPVNVDKFLAKTGSTGIIKRDGVPYKNWNDIVNDKPNSNKRKAVLGPIGDTTDVNENTTFLVQSFNTGTITADLADHITAFLEVISDGITNGNPGVSGNMEFETYLTVIAEIIAIPKSTVTAPYVSQNVTVDGKLSESAWDIATDISKVLYGTTDNTAKFGVLWDSYYLYVGVKVLDDNLYNDSRLLLPLYSGELFDDDCVAIFIDGDHSRDTNSNYDEHDRFFLKGWKNDGLDGYNAKGVLHGWATTPDGYSIEMAIPWTNLGITPTAGKPPIGFSVGYNDDDNGGVHEGSVVWQGTANNWTNTSALGDIVLGEAPSQRPQIINDLVTFEPIKSTYETISNTPCCGDGFVEQFSFDARLTNKSGVAIPFSDLVVKVQELTNGNLLQNADDGAGGAGASLTVPVPEEGGYADGVLSKGESVDVPFIICLKKKGSFSFVVDVLGIKGAASSQALETPQSTDTEPRRAKFSKGFFGRFRP